MLHKKKFIRIGIITTLFLIGAVFPVFDAKAATVEELITRIQELTRQLEALKKRSETVATPVELFVTDLRYGMKGNAEVRRLQQFLVDGGYLKKENRTGSFLSLTKEAVKRLQAVKKLPVTGVFDVQTREVANESLRNIGMTVSSSASVNGKTILIKTATSTALVQGVSMINNAPIRPATAVEPYHIDPRPAYDITMIERAAFDAVNVERQRNGLSALQWNDRLLAIARAHSSDQARDNIKITDSDVACLYPYIRHEGFVAGFRVGDRLDAGGIPYSMAGENLIIFPMSKDLIYRSTGKAPACSTFSDIGGVAGESQDAARTRIQKSLLDRLSLMLDQQKLDWVNKQWKTGDGIAIESARSWMDSPGHRHNILTPEFEESGMGAAVVNDYIILTQVFLKK